jgi:hypothetical protein
MRIPYAIAAGASARSGTLHRNSIRSDPRKHSILRIGHSEPRGLARAVDVAGWSLRVLGP